MIGKKAIAAICLALGHAPVAAQADPSFGVGVSFIFGGDVAVGVRVFSDDRAERGALALGLDYKLRGRSWRPNVGAAYLDEDWYVALSLGYDFSAQSVDFGGGLGLTSNVNARTTTPPVGPVTPPVGPSTDAQF